MAGSRKKQDPPHGGGQAKRMAALAKGNLVRRVQRDLRENFRTGKLDPYEVIAGNVDSVEQVVRRMKLHNLLVRVPGVGQVTADEVLQELNMRRDTRFEALTYERRRAVADLLRDALETPATSQPEV